MKALFLLAFGMLGHFVAEAGGPVQTASYTMQLKGQRYYAYPSAQVCGSAFAQAADERTLPASLGGGGGWNQGNQSFTSTAIPRNMSLRTVAVTVSFNTQVEAPVTVKLNGVAAPTSWSQAGTLRDGCQTATFEYPATAYVDGGVNTVYITPGGNAVIAVSTETVTITYSPGKGNPDDTPPALVQVCHKGDPIYVSSSAVSAHLGHGDSLGDCTGPAAQPAPGIASELSVAPNPATDQVAFTFRAARAGKAELQLFNQWGKLVATVYSHELAVGERNVLPFSGQNLPGGLYLCRLTTADGVQTTRLKLDR